METIPFKELKEMGRIKEWRLQPGGRKPIITLSTKSVLNATFKEVSLKGKERTFNISVGTMMIK